MGFLVIIPGNIEDTVKMCEFTDELGQHNCFSPLRSGDLDLENPLTPFCSPVKSFPMAQNNWIHDESPGPFSPKTTLDHKRNITKDQIGTRQGRKKIISLNIRGVGVGKDCKLGWIKSLCRMEKPNFLALQETKISSVDLNWICNLWGNNNCNFIQKENIGKFGGQLLIWDSSCFDVTNSFVSDFCVGIRGKWKSSGAEFNIVNVYGPHDDANKQKMWDFLYNIISNNDSHAWVICGDFNEVRSKDERLNSLYLEYRAKKFNELIEKSNLFDVPLGGRIFTRISDDGLKFSKLDRFLVNDAFQSLWCCIAAVALERKQSDHCPIILKDDEKNFGPKPIKVFDDWLEIDGIDQIIKDVWVDDGGGGSRKDCCLRNKLKKTKLEIKAKSLVKFGNLEGEIEMYKSIANSLEHKAELGQIDENERKQWLEARIEWF
ncbi:uncharacterized protein [Rutidosis leptorrhynchoides]|uniref:uncharacterized protein n=1 Tax=Rutidosis leptorrhynchoides TaxID=125765 RepID=UPI003A996F93